MKYVALLRGIGPMNPNMRNEKLRGVFEELGFKNVRSVISSGNIIFESDITNTGKLETQIEKAFPAKLGFNSSAIIRSDLELQKLLDASPFADSEHNQKSYLTVTFLKKPAEVPFKFPYQPPSKGYRLLAIHDRAIYAVTDLTTAKTPDLMSWLEKQFGKEITTRTLKTVQRILAKLD